MRVPELSAAVVGLVLFIVVTSTVASLDQAVSFADVPGHRDPGGLLHLQTLAGAAIGSVLLFLLSIRRSTTGLANAAGRTALIATFVSLASVGAALLTLGLAGESATPGRIPWTEISPAVSFSWIVLRLGLGTTLVAAALQVVALLAAGAERGRAPC